MQLKKTYMKDAVKVRSRGGLVGVLFSVLVLFYGCSSETNSQTVSKMVSEIPVPAAIRSAALPGGTTLIGSVYIDGNTTAAVTGEMTMPVIGNVEFTLSDIPVGDHTFTFVFEYRNDPIFPGTFELARASDTVSIVKGANPDLVFQDSDFDTSMDSDDDGVSNLAELDLNMRTDPGVATCILDKSILQNTALKGCELG